MTWSHSREVKAELSRVRWTSSGEAASELAGIWSVRGRAGRLAVGSALLARRAYALAKAIGADPLLEVRSHHGRGLLVRLQVERAEAMVVDDTQWPQAYLRGAFLASGYLADPERSYHMEIIARSPADARHLKLLLHRLTIEAGVAHRRYVQVVYIKDQEQVARLLAVLGAHSAHLALESFMVMKAMRNQVNRLVNSETANLRRTIESGMEQADALQRLAIGAQWEALPRELRELAELRLLHPDWSLRELGRALSPPLTKSGTAHRLRRLLRWTSKR